MQQQLQLCVISMPLRQVHPYPAHRVNFCLDCGTLLPTVARNRILYARVLLQRLQLLCCQQHQQTSANLYLFLDHELQFIQKVSSEVARKDTGLSGMPNAPDSAHSTCPNSRTSSKTGRSNPTQGDPRCGGPRSTIACSKKARTSRSRGKANTTQA